MHSGDEGAVIKIVCMGTDVTDERRKEVAEERFSPFVIPEHRSPFPCHTFGFFSPFPSHTLEFLANSKSADLTCSGILLHFV